VENPAVPAAHTWLSTVSVGTKFPPSRSEKVQTPFGGPRGASVVSKICSQGEKRIMTSVLHRRKGVHEISRANEDGQKLREELIRAGKCSSSGPVDKGQANCGENEFQTGGRGR